jgi:hypothetical protein
VRWRQALPRQGFQRPAETTIWPFGFHGGCTLHAELHMQVISTIFSCCSHDKWSAPLPGVTQ